MCITICLWSNSREVRSPLVYKHPRLKTAIGSFLISFLLVCLILFIILSQANGNYWTVYPAKAAVLAEPQLVLLYALLICFLIILLSTIFFRFFIAVAIAVAIIQVAMPLLVLFFLCHILWSFHIFYLLAAKVTAEVHILFFYFYQGYEKKIFEEIERADDDMTVP